MKELADLMYKEGFRSRSNIKYHKSKIYKLINDSFYCGQMQFHGKVYEGKHETIISRKLFDECQKAMQERQHPKKKRVHFPFRGLMTCAKYGCLLTASRKKKKYIYYYCTNARGNCSEHNHYLREDEAIKALSEVFDRLVVSEEMVEIMYQNSLEFFINNNPERREYLEAKQGLENELRRYKNRKDELFNLLLDKTITKESYEEREKSILSEINNFKEPFETLANSAKNTDIDKLRGAWYDLGTWLVNNRYVDIIALDK